MDMLPSPVEGDDRAVRVGLLGADRVGQRRAHGAQGAGEAEAQEQIWEVRRSAIEFTRVPGHHAGLAGWEDAAVGQPVLRHRQVPPERGHGQLQGRVPVPLLRGAAEPDTLVLADGFSCRTQIQHGTGRRPLHLAELLALARQHGPAGQSHPEPPAGREPKHPVLTRVGIALALAAAGGVANGVARRLH
jgi:hypothetical protein